VLGGSILRPELEAVMAAGGRHFVSIPDLEVAAGKRIAEMLKLPDGYTALVTSGAAAAIQSGLAGILTGDNEALIRQLPDLAGMKSEVLIQKSHRNPFDHQLRSTGIKLVEIETRDQLRHAVSDRTAMMHFTNFANGAGQIKVDEWVKLAKQYNLPCMNDAAADTPPVSISGITRTWDTISSPSAGKAMRGPQCAGLLVGRKDLVAYALLNNSRTRIRWPQPESWQRRDHWHGQSPGDLSPGRPRCVGKRVARSAGQNFSAELTKIPGVSTSFFTGYRQSRASHADFMG
jgi:L-seryl-tRNA(Ser) seleniumtransferase